MLTIIAFTFGLLILVLVGILWEKLLFSRLLDDPVRGKAASVAAAWLTCSGATILSLGTETVSWWPFAAWLIPAFPVAVASVYRGFRLRGEVADPVTAAQPFE